MKLNWRAVLIAGLAAIVTSGSFVLADYNMTQGSGTTIFSFTCFTTKVCPGQVPMNSAGTEIGTSSAPVEVNLRSATVGLAVTNAGTFATQATQAGTWTVQPGNTANTTAWLMTGTGGTFPSTQSGTWTVQPGNTANTTAWLVTGTGGTFPATQSGTWTVQPGNTANTTPWLVTAASATAPISSMNSATANGGVNAAMAGVFDDATPTAITENSFGFLRMSANRNLYGTIRDAAGNERGANVNASNQLSVSCDAGCAGGTFNNNADGVATSSTNGQAASWLYGFNGTTWDRLRADTTSGLWVNVKSATGAAQGSTTSGQTGSLVMGAVTTSAPSYTTAQTSPLSLDTSGNLRVNVVTGGGSGGTSSTFGAAFPATGTAIGVSDGTNMIALRAGTAGTAASTVLTVQGAASMTKLLVTPDSVALPANQSVNVAQINGVTTLMGNGVTGTGSQRVTIASDNTAFAVNSTLSAETTKVIGTVRTLGNAGAIFDAATGAAVPANALYVGMAQGGNLTGLTGTSGNLNVQCANCSGSGVSTADEAAFTAGSSLFAGTGGFFQTTATNNALTNGQQGMWQMTANRAGFVNVRNASGAELGLTAAPFIVSGPGTAGTAATGVVTVQGIASMTKLLVTPDSVALPANQSVNVSQINGVTPLMGNGTTGTGSQRVTIASDNTAFAVNATLSAETTKVIGTARVLGNAGAAVDAAIAAAPPANGLQMAAVTSGATGGLLTPVIQCDQNALLNMTTATTTEIVALTASQIIYVCSAVVSSNGTAAVKFVRGTGTNCGTGQADITANHELTAQTGYARGSGLGTVFRGTSANALCVTSSAAVNVHIDVSYAKY